MNIHHLELFHHVAEAGGITPALRRIPYGIGQPAVSAQIQKLEAELGLTLFRRRPFALTPEGRKLADFARPFFSGLPEIERVLTEDGRHRLRVGAIPSILRDYLPEILQKFTSRRPQLHLELRETDQREALDLLARQQIDLALTELSGRAGQGCEQRVLARVEPVLLVPVDSPWESSEELLQSFPRLPPLISYREEESAVRHFRRFLAERKIHWPTRLVVNAADLVKIYCQRGFGVGVYARLPNTPAPPGFRFLSLPGVSRFEIGALWTIQPTPLTQAFLSEVEARSRGLLD
ncbi:MAG: LysR family transcriptional regulator [Opitutales bacterium]|nr:LysR family transcriptional regulator [Opitutales bacterium]